MCRGAARPGKNFGAVLLVSWSLFILLPAARAAEPPDLSVSESERLRRLFDLAWEEKLRQTPEFATYIGFPGHNDRWSDFSPAGLERRHALPREQLKALQSIDRSRLTAAEQVHLDLFRRRLEGQIEGFGFPAEQTMITQSDGIQQSVPYVLALAHAATLHDYEFTPRVGRSSRRSNISGRTRPRMTVRSKPRSTATSPARPGPGI